MKDEEENKKETPMDSPLVINTKTTHAEASLPTPVPGISGTPMAVSSDTPSYSATTAALFLDLLLLLLRLRLPRPFYFGWDS